MAKSAFAILLLLAIVPRNHGVPRPIKIGAIFHRGEYERSKAFTDALTQLKNEYTAPAFDLQPIIKWIDVSTDSFNTAAAACELVAEGVAAIFGPGNPFTRGIVSSIAARFEIPHIEFAFRRMEDSAVPPTSINAYPDGNIIVQAIADMTKMMNWKSFTAIYETDDGLSRIQAALSLHGPQDSPVTLRQLGSGPDYRPLLKDIKNTSVNYNVLVDVSADRMNDLLLQARELNILGDYFTYAITYLDSTILPIVSTLNGTTANVTGFKLTTSNFNGYTEVESALLFDSVLLFGFTLEVFYKRNKGNKSMKIEPVPLSCNGTQKYQAGPHIAKLMRELSRVGNTTGTMIFDDEGRRYFEPRVVEFQNTRYMETAIWSRDKGVFTTKSQEERESELRQSLERKVFKVTTREGAPYVMQVKDGSNRGVPIDDARYEGYCIDLIDAIAKLLNFKYEFELAPDKNYGSYDEKTKQWNGLVKRLLDRNADLAICDLTISSARRKAVDFTMPFMNLGISILFSKPESKEPDLFSFLSPLSTDVWICMTTAYLVVSMMLFLQARLAPGEYMNPHPCKQNPEELENDFTIMNCMWVTMGSLMQQGSDILPRTTSVRMLAGMWWFFVLIMVSSYTANLAAFLTAVKMDVSINNVDDLAKQTKIKYGAVSGGSTLGFFKDSNASVYQRMYAAMMDAKPGVFTKTNDEGVERVIKGKRQYAFLMESTSIEYQVERHCELQQVGEWLDSKGYGIAMPLNSPYRTLISGAVLKLQETGMLQQLKDKWWKQMHGGGTCSKDDKGKSGSSSKLGMRNVGGVFLVLIFGCAFAVFMVIFEFLWNVRKVAVTEKITPWEALLAELKFAVNIRAETKPVKVEKSSSGSSSTVDGFKRAASTARSMERSFLRLDILGTFDKENSANSKDKDQKIS